MLAVRIGCCFANINPLTAAHVFSNLQTNPAVGKNAGPHGPRANPFEGECPYPERMETHEEGRLYIVERYMFLP